MTIEQRNGHIRGAERTEAGTYVFPASSEQPYRRYDGVEVLSHDADAVDLTFLNSGNAPLLDNHDRHSGLRAQIGVIMRAWLDKKRVYVEAKFSNREDVAGFQKDVDDGIIRNVSIGYSRDQIEYTEGSDEYLVKKWTPKEVSFVTIPADETVGVGRSATKEGHSMSAEKKETVVLPGVQTDEQRAEAMTTAMNEITALAKTHGRADLANAFIKGEVARGNVPSIEVFRGVMRAELPEDVPLVNTDIGLTGKQAQSFSLRKLINATIMPDATRADVEEAKFELEAVEAAGAARQGTLVLPTDIMNTWGRFTVDGVQYDGARAALSASGNANVQSTDHLGARFIDNLRNRMVLGRLGLTVLSGLDGNVDIPGGNANIASAWLGSEDANAAESNPSFRKISLAIKDLAVYTDMTRRMLQQSTIDIEAYVRMQILEAMAQGIDLAGFYGSGSSGQPTGLTLTSGIGSVTFAGTYPTRGEVIDMRTAIASTNLPNAPTYVGNSAMVGAMMKTAVDAGSGRFLMENRTSIATGDAFEETNQIAAGDLITGYFPDMIMGMWGGLELGRSTEAKFLSGGVRLRAIQSLDFGVRRVGSFVLGNDGV